MRRGTVPISQGGGGMGGIPLGDQGHRNRPIQRGATTHSDTAAVADHHVLLGRPALADSGRTRKFDSSRVWRLSESATSLIHNVRTSVRSIKGEGVRTPRHVSLHHLLERRNDLPARLLWMQCTWPQ